MESLLSLVRFLEVLVSLVLESLESGVWRVVSKASGRSELDEFCKASRGGWVQDFRSFGDAGY